MRPLHGRFVHISHPELKPDSVEFRGFQANLARIAFEKNSLIVLPTGMGKTVVALLALADAFKHGAKRILLMAPTKPLVEQHANFFDDLLPNRQVQLLTGHLPPAKREAGYKEEGLLCATPQVISNDAVTGRLDLGSFDWIVFDECHRATGEYPYAFIGRNARKANSAVRAMGLTASPGHDRKKIDEVRDHLGLTHVEIRTTNDPDVAPFVQMTDVQWETLPLPANMARVSKCIQTALAKRVRALKQQGSLKAGGSRPSRTALLEAGRKLQAMVKGRDPGPEVYAALSNQAQAMKLIHALELAETQGSDAFRAFVEKTRTEAKGSKASKANKVLAEDPDVAEGYNIAKFDEQDNPKLGRTSALVQDVLAAKGRAIVFANYRSTVEIISKHLQDIPGAKPVVFVGQGKRGGSDGLTQKQQQELLQKFRDGEFNVLCATSVAEEGLDIPSTDLVVFYEPIPSEIRSIQRRGRTGRHGTGKVVVLMTKGTVDEAAHWSAKRKEQAMVQELHSLRGTFQGNPVQVQRQQTLAPAPETPKAAPDGVKIIADNREQAGGVVRSLHESGAKMEMRNLDIGDFVLSDRIIVERKTWPDLLSSLVDGRLFSQLKAMQSYPKPFVVLEGAREGGHGLSHEAVYGALASIVVDLGIPIMHTEDAADTAEWLLSVAKREQKREKRKIAVRQGKPMEDAERLRFVLSGFPGIDGVRADALLSHFGSIVNVFTATRDEISAVAGIGPKTAAEVHRILHMPTETV